MTAVRPARTRSVPGQPIGVSFRSADVDETRTVLNRLHYPLAVRLPGGAEGFTFSAEVIQLGPLTVGRLAFGAPVTLLEHELAALLGRTVDAPIDLPPEIDLTGGAARSWQRLLQLLSTESADPAGLIWRPVMAEQLRRSVLNGLLLSVHHRYSDELSATPPSGPPRVVRRVIDAITDEPERPFSAAGLAAIAGTSVRSLQEGFRRYVGCTPRAYLQSVRLDRAHEALRSQDPGRVTVAAVAHRAGFAHLSRFALAYRARFGVNPSETLRHSA